MNAAFEKRLLVVWLALSAITVAQLGLGPAGDRARTPNAAVAAGAVAIALVKVRFILREFMEVRHAPLRLGRLADLWIVSTGAILLAGHLAGRMSAGG